MRRAKWIPNQSAFISYINSLPNTKVAFSCDLDVRDAAAGSVMRMLGTVYRESAPEIFSNYVIGVEGLSTEGPKIPSNYILGDLMYPGEYDISGYIYIYIYSLLLAFVCEEALRCIE